MFVGCDEKVQNTKARERKQLMNGPDQSRGGGMTCQAAVHPSRTAPFHTAWLVEVCDVSTFNIPNSTPISILLNIFYFRRMFTASQITLLLWVIHSVRLQFEPIHSVDRGHLGSDTMPPCK
jgi:hypothetical protein